MLDSSRKISGMIIFRIQKQAHFLIGRNLHAPRLIDIRLVASFQGSSTTQYLYSCAVTVQPQVALCLPPFGGASFILGYSAEGSSTR